MKFGNEPKTPCKLLSKWKYDSWSFHSPVARGFRRFTSIGELCGKKEKGAAASLTDETLQNVVKRTNTTFFQNMETNKEKIRLKYQFSLEETRLAYTASVHSQIKYSLVVSIRSCITKLPCSKALRAVFLPVLRSITDNSSLWKYLFYKTRSETCRAPTVWLSSTEHAWSSTQISSTNTFLKSS